jgi:hypothetical protein
MPRIVSVQTPDFIFEWRCQQLWDIVAGIISLGELDFIFGSS